MDIRKRASALIFAILGPGILLHGCGAESNLWGLTIPPAHLASFEHRLAKAQASYDAGDLQTAKSNIDKAFALNPNSEQASLLYGFIYLSLAGADPFALARKMSGSKEDDDEEDDDEMNDPGSTSSELSRIEAAIGLSESEKSQLGTIDTSNADLPVLIPFCAEQARAALEKLSYIDKAIYAACPFVNESTRISGDARHRCAPSSVPPRQASKAHFLWAFSHLTEALAFNAALNFGAQSGQPSNLEQRVNAIKEMQVSSPAQLNAFLARVQAVEQTVNAILPLEETCSEASPTSMLVATLTDMLAVNAAFAQMASIPTSITSGIKKSMAKINEIKGSGDKLTNLKSDMTKKMGAILTEKLNALEAESGGVSAEQRIQLCSTYDSITAGSDAKPAMCGG